MRVVVVTKDGTEYSRAVEMFLRDLARQTGKVLEVLDPESTEGETFCRAYDIVEYPTIVALSTDGQLQNIWRGATLPTISEVSYYATQG
ncbi:MAG TPA: hypothetical protein PL191_00720 [Candidatus Saccharimonas sp.]|nr:hypothetical protein [Candidatus Saccharibacteria bacterium]HPQ82246.1 hypothetical protein [Candidatus Saccharimonas sp.]